MPHLFTDFVMILGLYKSIPKNKIIYRIYSWYLWRKLLLLKQKLMSIDIDSILLEDFIDIYIAGFHIIQLPGLEAEEIPVSRMKMLIITTEDLRISLAIKYIERINFISLNVFDTSSASRTICQQDFPGRFNYKGQDKQKEECIKLVQALLKEIINDYLTKRMELAK